MSLAEYQSTQPVPRLAAAEEVTRVREHLLGAIMAVGAASTAALSPAQRTRRALLLGQLIRYAVRGRFPKNVRLPDGMEPTFVDSEGTRCAMACLIDHTGEHALVDRVAATANHAYVRDLAVDSALVDWLTKHGLSAEEAGRIQPGYCGTPGLECICETSFISADDLVAGVLQADGTLLVDEVYESVSGIQVGDALEVSNDGGFRQGERVFAEYTDGAYAHYAFADADSLATSSCASFPGTPPATLDIDVLLDIVGGAECLSTLQAADPNWVDQGECDDGGGIGGESSTGGADAGGSTAVADDGGSSSDGCSFSSLPAHESGLLLALVTGLAIARNRRRQRPA